MTISILGAGAFGTALAISLAREGQSTTLWTRDTKHADIMQKTREIPDALQAQFPDSMTSRTI